jgi:tetratricopeptide (TPR) repeat protein
MFHLTQAIVLGKALLTEKETESMSLKHKKEFLFELGNAYFLVGNYADAKSKYSECLDTDPSNELKSRVLNNLGLVCWWQKNPLFPEKVIESQKLKIDNIDSDFKQTREIFLKSLEKSENPIEILDEGEQLRMKQALREEELNVKVNFRHATSVQPIFNLVQYYMNNEPTEKVKIFFWLRALLQVSKAS